MMGPSSKVRFIGALVIASGVLLGILLLLNSPQALEQTQELRDPTDPGDPAPNDSTQRFVVSQQPRLVIGDDESDPRYQTVQVNGALRLSDGRLVVAENATAEIRFYDSAGSYQGSVGGRGRGPGEFEEISQIQLGGADSIYAFDRRLQRFTVFDSDGTFGRSDLVGRGDTRYNALEHLSDGAWIGKTFGKGGVGPIGSLIRDTVELILLDSDGDRLSSLGRCQA